MPCLNITVSLVITVGKANSCRLGSGYKNNLIRNIVLNLLHKFQKQEKCGTRRYVLVLGSVVALCQNMGYTGQGIQHLLMPRTRK